MAEGKVVWLYRLGRVSARLLVRETPEFYVFDRSWVKADGTKVSETVRESKRWHTLYATRAEALRAGVEAHNRQIARAEEDLETMRMEREKLQGELDQELAK